MPYGAQIHELALIKTCIIEGRFNVFLTDAPNKKQNLYPVRLHPQLQSECPLQVAKILASSSPLHRTRHKHFGPVRIKTGILRTLVVGRHFIRLQGFEINLNYVLLSLIGQCLPSLFKGVNSIPHYSIRRSNASTLRRHKARDPRRFAQVSATHYGGRK